MKELDLEKFRRARVWMECLSDSIYQPVRTVTHVVPGGGYSRGATRSCTIELFIPLGARSMYGLIGGRLDSSNLENLTIDVGVSSESERVFLGSLASKVDEVKVGLLGEYAESVISGLDVAILENNEIDSGRLSINCGAYGVVGGSRMVYEMLGAILIDILSVRDSRISNLMLVDFFRRRIG